jgi:hypothetical protein
MKFTVTPTTDILALAWPGLYPVYYATSDGGTLCPKCVNTNRGLCADPADPQWNVTDTDINWESTDLTCEHCNAVIDSAYGESNPTE